MRTMSNNPDDHTMKKTAPFIYALLFLIGLAVPFRAIAEDFAYKTTLVIKETKTYSPPASTPPDPACGGITVGTPTTQPPSAPYDVYRILATPADFTRVSFRVFKTDDLNTTVYPFLDNDAAAVNFNSTTGEISFNLTDIATSRKSYTVKVYLNSGGTGTPYESKEFYTSQANTAPPIGTIIPYYGSAASVAALNLGGWFLCDGTAISSISDDILFPDEKSALTSVVGSNFPDLRGLFLRGAGTNSYDPASPRSVGNIQTEQAGFTAHQYQKADNTTGSSNVSLNTGSTNVRNDAANISVIQNASLSNGNHNHSITFSNQSTTDPNPGSTETRPDNVAVTYIIKARR